MEKDQKREIMISEELRLSLKIIFSYIKQGDKKSAERKIESLRTCS